MPWTEWPSEDIRRPLFRNERDWTLYFWRGRDRGWVICRPEGTRLTATREFDDDQVAAAQAWADRLVEGRTNY